MTIKSLPTKVGKVIKKNNVVGFLTESWLSKHFSDECQF